MSDPGDLPVGEGERSGTSLAERIGHFLLMTAAFGAIFVLLIGN